MSKCHLVLCKKDAVAGGDYCYEHRSLERPNIFYAISVKKLEREFKFGLKNSKMRQQKSGKHIHLLNDSQIKNPFSKTPKDYFNNAQLDTVVVHHSRKLNKLDGAYKLSQHRTKFNIDRFDKKKF